MSEPGELSPDQRFVWDGAHWVPSVTPDGTRRWDGRRWVSTGRGGRPFGPPPPDFSARAGAAVSRPALQQAKDLAEPEWRVQIGGNAGISLACGFVALLSAQIVSPIDFPVLALLILPVGGLWRGFVAAQSRRRLGGWAGVALNLLGAFAVVTASGVLHSLSAGG